MYMNNSVRRSLFGCAVLLSGSPAAFAGDLEGRVMTSDGRPVSNATVTLEGTDIIARTDARGHFHIENIDAGQYLVRINRKGESTTEAASVSETGITELEVRFDVALEEVIVQYSPFADRSLLEMSQPVELLSGDELNQLKEASIGETLANQLGVSSTYGGPATGRPVIRGLTGNRVRVQQSGIGSLDVSALSPDHAVSIEPLLIDTVEIVKGPATLLYGNGAFGGVVNLEDSRIPDEAALSPINGAFELRGDTAANERTGVIRVDGGHDMDKGSFAWHADVFRRSADDVEIPAASESFALREQEGIESGEPIESGEGGTLENSNMDTEGGAFGASWIGENGFFGAAISTYRSNYGVPGHAHEEAPAPLPGAEPEGVRIDLEQTRYDIKSRFDTPFEGIESLKFRLGYNNYTHREIEDGMVATTFDNDALDARVELVHAAIDGWRGAFGVQVNDRDFAATGDEAYVPPTTSSGYGLFLVEEKEIGPGRFEIGGRIETQDQDPENGPSQSDTAYSISTGYSWRVSEDYRLGTNLTRAQRMPDIEERYSNGPHLATLQYEIGDPDLGQETANNIDLNLRRHKGSLNWTINLFYNRVDDFIYLANTGAELDGLPVFVYTHADAVLKGYEAEIETAVWSEGSSEIKLRLFSDQTRGTLVDGGNLPRIPPRRAGVGLEYMSVSWTAGLKATHHARQDDIAELELPTDSYTMLDANVSYRLLSAHIDWDIFLRATNLLDEEARRHTSFLKDLAPLPGRNFTLGVRGSF